jgi:adenylate cyclase
MNEAPPGDKTALPTRFGLHYGPVFLGEVGADADGNCGCVGDIVNTSSRIQSANKALGTRILASGAVLEQPAPPTRPRLPGTSAPCWPASAAHRPPRNQPRPPASDARQAFDTARQAYASALDLARLHLRIALAASPATAPLLRGALRARLAGEPLPDADGCIVLTQK